MRSAVFADPPANPVFSSPPKTILGRVSGPVESVQREMVVMKEGDTYVSLKDQGILMTRTAPPRNPVLNGVEVDPVNALGTYQNIYDCTSKKQILNAIESDLAHREQYRNSGHWEIHAHSSRDDVYQNINEEHPHSKVLSSVERDVVQAEVQNLGTRSSRAVILVEGKHDAVTNSGAYQNIYDSKSKK